MSRLGNLIVTGVSRFIADMYAESIHVGGGGIDSSNAVHIGSTAPSQENILLWLDTKNKALKYKSSKANAWEVLDTGSISDEVLADITTKVKTAQTTAETAKTTADIAKTTATTAKSTADTALSNANNTTTLLNGLIKTVNASVTVNLVANSDVTADFGKYKPSGYYFIGGVFAWGGSGYGNITRSEWSSYTSVTYRLRSSSNYNGYAVNVLLIFVKAGVTTTS